MGERRLTEGEKIHLLGNANTSSAPAAVSVPTVKLSLGELMASKPAPPPDSSPDLGSGLSPGGSPGSLELTQTSVFEDSPKHRDSEGDESPVLTMGFAGGV